MLEDLQKEQIAGLFYEPKMVLVNNKEEDLVFCVEKILGRRTHNGIKEVLIKWKCYSNRVQLVAASISYQYKIMCIEKYLIIH